MQTAYHAANIADAQILCDLLRQEGIECHILGGFLQGAAGLLPAEPMVRIQVPDEQLQQAKVLIAAWDAATPLLDESFDVSGGTGVGTGTDLSASA